MPNNWIKSEWTKMLFALVLVVLAGLIRSVLIPGLRETPYVIFYPAVILAALYGGLRAGLLAALLAGFGSATWFGPGTNIHFYLPGSPSGLITFLAGSVIIVYICAQLDRARKKIAAEAHSLRESERSLQAEIAARGHAEESLRQSETFLNAIIENAPACIKLVAADGTLLKMNAAGLRIIGCDSLARVQGKSIFNLVASEDRPAFMKLTRDVFDNKAGKLEFEANSLDGRRIWLSTYAVPLHDSSGNISALLGITIDITERKAMETALRESQARLEGIASTAFDAVILIDNDGNVSFWNEGASRMFGYSREEMLGRHMHAYLMPLRHNDAFVKGFEAFRETGKGPLVGSVYEVEAKRKNGAEFPAELSLSALKLNGKWYAVGIVRDISDRKQAEESLKRINAQNKLILESAGEGIWGVDPRGVVTFINKTGAEALGYDLSELVGKPSHATWHYKRPDGTDYPPEECPIYAAYKDGIEHSGEETFWKKDGLGFPADFTSRPIFEGNRVAGAVVTFRDITERKRAEQALRRSEERLRVAASAAEIGMWYWMPGTNSVQVTANWRQLFGIEPGTAVTFETWRSALHQEDRERAVRELAAAREERREFDTEYRVVLPDGSIRWLVDRGRAWYDEKGRAAGMAGVNVDITERKQAETEKERLIDELKRSNSELEQFAYVASHDLQEPLRMVGSYVTLLKTKYKDRLDQKANEYIHFAVDGAERMQKLIEGLLAYSRISRRGAEFRTVDLNTVFSAAISNLSVMIAESRAMITRDDLPVVCGDETQLVQLFQNLIGNGVKYAKKEVRPEVHVAATKDGMDCLVSITDNGIGIESRYYDRIFQIFQRLHTRSEYSGTGIGLALCKRIVERHHGRIWVESVPGQGSTFFFTVPIKTAPWPSRRLLPERACKM